MSEEEFNEKLVIHDIAYGGDHDQGFGCVEDIFYDNVCIITHEDMGSANTKHYNLNLKWVEGKRKFIIRNEKSGFDTSKVYDVWELYQQKKGSKK